MIRFALLILSTVLAAMASQYNGSLIHPRNKTHQVATLKSTNKTMADNLFSRKLRYSRFDITCDSIMWCLDNYWQDDDWGGFHINVWLAHPWKRQPVCWECFTKGRSKESDYLHDYTTGCNWTKYTPQLCKPLQYDYKDPVLPPIPVRNSAHSTLNYPKLHLDLQRHALTHDFESQREALVRNFTDEQKRGFRRFTDDQYFEKMARFGANSTEITHPDDENSTHTEMMPRAEKIMRRVTFEHPFLPGVEACGAAHWRNDTSTTEEWITIRRITNLFEMCDAQDVTVEIGFPRASRTYSGHSDFQGIPP